MSASAPEADVRELPASLTRTGVPAAMLSLPAIGLLVLINALWSGSSVASKNALNSFGPCTLALLRFLPAGILLYGLERVRGYRPVYERRDWSSFFLLGAIGIALTYAIYYSGVEKTTASDSSLMFACEPLLIALFAVVFLRERLHLFQWLGMLVGILGIWLIAGQAIGNAIALLGLAVESSMIVIGKRLATRYRGLTICTAELLVGSACLLPFAARECILRPPHLTTSGILSALYLCLICSALCYGVWWKLLERFQASAMGAFILIQPVFGPYWSWALRGEPLKRGSAIGGALVVAGLILTSLVRLRSGGSNELLADFGEQP